MEDSSPKSPVFETSFNVFDMISGAKLYSLFVGSRRGESSWLNFELHIQQRVAASIRVSELKWRFKDQTIQQALSYRFESMVL